VQRGYYDSNRCVIHIYNGDKPRDGEDPDKGRLLHSEAFKDREAAMNHTIKQLESRIKDKYNGNTNDSRSVESHSTNSSDSRSVASFSTNSSDTRSVASSTRSNDSNASSRSGTTVERRGLGYVHVRRKSSVCWYLGACA
jgi:hypothetical protein